MAALSTAGNSIAIILPTIQFAQSRLKIYVDCNQQWLCDMDFLRKEMGSVDFVRDRFLCDVQIISNVQFNGNGGSPIPCVSFRKVWYRSAMTR